MSEAALLTPHGSRRFRGGCRRRQYIGERRFRINLFSIDWNWRFWRLDPCANCGKNVWRKDWVFAKKSAGRPRYECFYCGQDVYPGGAVNEKLANLAEESLVGASSSAWEPLNTTDDGHKGHYENQ